MKYKVSRIEVDFTGDSEDKTEALHNQPAVYDAIYSKEWEADDEDDLVNQISNETGWCIRDIDYSKV